MTEHLHLWGQAANLVSGDDAHAREAARRIDPDLATLHDVRTVAARPEDDRVNVHLTTVAIDELDAPRRIAVDVVVPMARKDVDQRLDIR
jgi:hypothetical protein